MKFKVGDRVVCPSEIFPTLENVGEWSGTIEYFAGNDYFWIRADRGSSWQDKPINLIPEEVFNSPLFQALT